VVGGRLRRRCWRCWSRPRMGCSRKRATRAVPRIWCGQCQSFCRSQRRGGAEVGTEKTRGGGGTCIAVQPAQPDAEPKGHEQHAQVAQLQDPVQRDNVRRGRQPQHDGDGGEERDDGSRGRHAVRDVHALPELGARVRVRAWRRRRRRRGPCQRGRGEGGERRHAVPVEGRGARGADGGCGRVGDVLGMERAISSRFSLLAFECVVLLECFRETPLAF
jgi:hypothetical protein